MNMDININVIIKMSITLSADTVGVGVGMLPIAAETVRDSATPLALDSMTWELEKGKREKGKRKSLLCAITETTSAQRAT